MMQGSIRRCSPTGDSAARSRRWPSTRGPGDGRGGLPGRPPAPVESAVYFAVAECLANVVKHSGATSAWVDLRHEDGRADGRRR